MLQYQRSVSSFERDRVLLVVLFFGQQPPHPATSVRPWRPRGGTQCWCSDLREACMQEDATRRLRFREEIRKLIENNSRRGTAEISRLAVEEIGTSLGMTEVEACREFLGFK